MCSVEEALINQEIHVRDTIVDFKELFLEFPELPAILHQLCTGFSGSVTTSLPFPHLLIPKDDWLLLKIEEDLREIGWLFRIYFSSVFIFTLDLSACAPTTIYLAPWKFYFMTYWVALLIFHQTFSSIFKKGLPQCRAWFLLHLVENWFFLHRDRLNLIVNREINVWKSCKMKRIKMCWVLLCTSYYSLHVFLCLTST